MKRQPKKLFSYSDYEAREEELEYRRENWKYFFDNKPTEQELEENINNDDDFYRGYWESFQDDLDNLMTETQKAKNSDNNPGFWLDNAKGMGWRNLSGYKVFSVNTTSDFLEAITPRNCDYSISIHKGGKTFFYARISHHDAPTGEWHRIQAITEARYNQLND